MFAFAALYAADVSYAAAAVVAYLLSNALMYLGNRYFTFRLGREGLLQGYARYVVVGLLVVALNVVLLAGLVEGAGLDPRLGQAFSLLALTPVAFVANKRWTFQLRPRLTPPRSAPAPTIAALVTTLVVVVVCVVVEVSGDTDDPRRSSFVLASLTALFAVRVGGRLEGRPCSAPAVGAASDGAVEPSPVSDPSPCPARPPRAHGRSDRGPRPRRRPAAGSRALDRRTRSSAARARTGRGWAVRCADSACERQSGERWFGGTIPIVFHCVLAAWLFVLGLVDATA